MAFFLSFEVEGTEEVQKGLAAFLAALNNMSLFWTDVFAPKYFAIAQDMFATGGRARGAGGKFSGGAWKGLTPKYRVWKKKHYPGKPILVRSGELKESVRWSGAVGPGGIFEAHPTFAIAGTSVPYAKYHDKGTSKMVARRFLPPPDPAIFAPLMKDWLLKTSNMGKA